MLPVAISATGVVFITTSVPGATSTKEGGIARSATGQLHVVAAAPNAFVNGFGVSHLGQLCYSPGGVISKYSMGLPFTADDRLVTQLNQIPAATDPYVAGIRVGNTTGVFTTDVAPGPGTAFSSGFSRGFS